MRLLARSRSTSLGLVAATVLLSGCGALDGDAPPSAATGLFDGDLVATALDGDVTISAAELERYTDAVTETTLDATSGDDAIAQRVTDQSIQLANMLVFALVRHEAQRELDAVVTAEQIDAELAQRIEAAGGEDAFATELANAGATRASVRANVEGALLVQTIGAALVAGDEQADPAAAFGQWFSQLLADAEPAVAARFGTWDRVSQTVVPFGQEPGAQDGL